MGTLQFEPLIPFPLWLTLLAVGVGLFIGYAWRRPGGMSRPRWTWIITLSATGLALVMAILLNPTWVEKESPPGGKPLLSIVVDATESMATPDASAGRTRWQEASKLAHSCAEELGDRFDVRLFAFAERPIALDKEDLKQRKPDGRMTDIAAAITQTVDSSRPQGQMMLLMSDGIHNAGGGSDRVLEAVQKARAQSCRIYTLTVGGDTNVQDVAVELRSPLELAFVGQKVPVAVRLRQRGYDGALAVIGLYGQEKEIREEVRLSKEITEHRFEVSQDKPGLYRYEVRAEPLPGEISTVNNTATFVLRVIDEPVRLLLLEGKPYWDAKFLVRTILADPSVELDSVVRMTEHRFLRRTLKRGTADKQGEIAPVREEWKTMESFGDPAQPEWLRQYQIVVLGRDAEVFLNDAVLAQLRKWLQNDGGCLICYRGKPTALVSERLGQLMPVRWTPVRESRFRLELTDRGQDMRWFGLSGLESAEVFGRLPTLATTARAENPRPLATVLATAAADQPVLSYQPVGTGRVVVIEGTGMWRWAFLPPQQQALEDVYRSLWHNLLRWAVSSADLLPGQQVALRSDKISFNVNESASATMLLRDERGRPPAVELKGAGLSAPRTVTPVPLADEVGAFRVNFGKLPEGWYQARAVMPAAAEGAPAECAFDVRSFAEEQLDLKARPDLMARIAQLSGGSVISDARAQTIARHMQQDLEAGRTVRVRRLSAWDRWWVLLAGLGLWTATWSLRRRSGLV